MTKNRRWAAVLLIAVLIGTGVQTAAAAEIGVLKLELIMLESRVGREARARARALEQGDSKSQEIERFNLRLEQALEQVSEEQELEVVLFSNGVAWGGRDITAQTRRCIDQEGAGSMVEPAVQRGGVGVIDTYRVMREISRIRQSHEKIQSLEKTLTETLRTEKERLNEAEYAERSMQLKQNAEVLVQEWQDEVKFVFDQAVDKVATDKRLTIVLHKDRVVQGGVDITAEVLQVL